MRTHTEFDCRQRRERERATAHLLMVYNWVVHMLSFFTHNIVYLHWYFIHIDMSIKSLCNYDGWPTI